MTRRRSPVFLERQNYRRRRWMEAARLMPLLGAVLFALPLMWPRPDDPDVVAGAVATVPTSSAMAYIFGVWAVLVGAAILFGWLSRGWADTDGAG